MPATSITTEFAPAERHPIDVIRRQSASIAESPLTPRLLESMLDAVFILNQQRQIVFANQNALPLATLDVPKHLLGMRPGEVLGCQHAQETQGGCGTTLFCSECGAVKAILSGLEGRREVQECHVTRLISCGTSEALDLLVCGTPFHHQGESYCVFAVADISHEKRRRALERVFFHDVLNSAWGLASLAGMLTGSVAEDLKDDMMLLNGGLHDLLEEIQMQKDLAAAENNELETKFVPVNARDLLDELVRFYQVHHVAANRGVRLAPDTAGVVCSTDRILLRRVLGNLIKNALEAIKPRWTVTAGCRGEGGQLRFWVHNPTVMSREVQLQVFNRSFSTKGLGRGLGTYSVRLLTERYLNGSVDFVSNEEDGTTFYVLLPRAVNDM